MRACLLALASLSWVGCAASPSAVPRPPVAVWRESFAEFERLRASLAPARRETRIVRATLREPRTGFSLAARGALALDPPRSLRLLLLGPGGTTVLDLWMRDDRYSLRLPAANLTKVGDRSTPTSERRALPVDALGALLLTPLRGELLDHERLEGGARFALRGIDAAGAPVVTIAEVGLSGMWLDRRAPGERVDARVEVGFGPCGRARYEDASGLVVEVQCETIEADPPPDEAFAEPSDVGS